MTTDKRREGSGKPRVKKAAQRRVASESSASKSGKEIDVSVTTTSPVGAGTSAAGSDAGQKDFLDFLGGILPGAAETVAPTLGLDPRVAGGTVRDILNIFGIGAGKAFTTAVPKDQAVSQLQQVVTPYLSDPAFRTVLGRWMQAAIEPVQAQKEGKAYQPSVDMSKNWFTDAVDSIGDAISKVDVQQVVQVGMRALPYVVAAVA
jgi:hypothetical protein